MVRARKRGRRRHVRAGCRLGRAGGAGSALMAGSTVAKVAILALADVAALLGESGMGVNGIIHVVLL